VSPALLRYDVVDVFTDRPYAGNPLAVVHGGGELPSEALQAIAREFNLSETSFPTPIDESTYTARIFTPDMEVPFAGHPTLGTAWVLRQRGELGPAPAVQRCGAGDIAVTAGSDGARLSAAARELGPPLQLPDLLVSIGLAESDVLATVRAASCGLGFVFVRVSPQALRSSRAAGSSWTAPATGIRDPLGGVCVYATQAPQRAGPTSQPEPARVLARVYCPEAGVPEDPATGSAAAALGLVLVADGVVAGEGSTPYTVTQGAQVGRPSRLDCVVEAFGSAGRVVHVGGGVRAVASGSLLPPGS
jgi:trans-2,3-dihydro-3-hydroxyanthranilate isomerase